VRWLAPDNPARRGRIRRLQTDVPLALLIAIALMTAYRFISVSALQLPLHYDEAQYLGWSLAPDFGYFSKPPMIAWVIGLARSVCGPSEACVRAPAALACALAAVFAAAAAGVMADARSSRSMRAGHVHGNLSDPSMANRSALWTGLTLASLPLVSFYGSFATTDSLLLMCWCAALWTFARATVRPERPQLSWWLATGLACGLGLLSKYTMGVFALSALIWLLTDPKRRQLLRTPGPWLCAVIAALLFAPNVLWNLKHGFATVQHTAEISRAATTATGGLAAWLEFLIAQPLLLGVGFALAAAVALLKSGPHPSGRSLDIVRFGWTFCWPMLAVISVQAWNSRAHANWAAPALAGAAIAAAGWLAAGHRRRSFALAMALNLLVLVAVAHGPVWMKLTGLDARYPRNPWSRLAGWPEVGAAVNKVLQAEPQLQVLSDDRRVLSELIAYAGPGAFPAWAFSPDLRRTDHYRLLYNIAERASPERDGPYLFVAQSGRYDEARLKASFRAFKPMGSVIAPIDGRPGTQLDLIRVQGLITPPR
jgi:hypothetical protein